LSLRLSKQSLTIIIAIAMQYFYSALISLSVLALGGVALAEGKVNVPQGNQYPASFVQGYNQECIQTSIEEGLDQAEAKKLCDCTLNEFEQQYSLEEFQQLTNASATKESAQTTLIEVGQFCFEQILYEE
jgi:hypothetical protein